MCIIALVKEVNSLLKKNHAFTLIEVLVTLALISIIIVLAVPYFTNSLAHHQTVSTVRKLVSDIQYTQQLAIKTEDTYSSYEIVFNPALENYYLKHGSKILRLEKFPPWVDLAGTNLANSYQREILAFNVQGSPIRAGTITIINKRSGKVYYVRVAVLTGRVRVDY